MAMQGRHFTRTQVMAWVELWSYTDRAWITAALDAIPNGACVLPPCGGYIGVWTTTTSAPLSFTQAIWCGQGSVDEGPAAGPVPGHAAG